MPLDVGKWIILRIWWSTQLLYASTGQKEISAWGISWMSCHLEMEVCIYSYTVALDFIYHKDFSQPTFV